MSGQKDIGLRLENWSRWCLARSGRGPDCMTGAICDGMRKAALGSVQATARIATDEPDAVRIELGMRKLANFDRLLLDWCYIEQARPEVISRKLSFHVREFVERFRAAQQAIEAAAIERKP